MNEREYNLCQDLIEVMRKHGAVGFVGSFCLKDIDGFATLRIVHPEYDETPFKIVEDRLVSDVNQVFGAQESSREAGYVNPKKPFDEMPH